ncbi:MAG: hypothetical protein Q7I98_08890 [Erysipelotrichaceae bacterium]|nr:hypothetical protein [Erysipelotrichaceae bacterium]
MDTFKKTDLERLLHVEADGCVSIYLPTFKAGPEVQQGPILLKNLLKEAEERLVALGRRRPEVLEQLKPIDKLMRDAEFWKFQSDGLAIFLSPDGLETFRLPVQFEPVVCIDKKFNIRPLMPHLHGDGVFYILALSLNDVRFFKASKHEIEEFNIEALPVNLDQALNMDKSQGATLNRAPGFNSGVPSHGSLELSEFEKTEIRQYFRIIDRALSKTLKTSTRPLVIACIDALFALYKEVNVYAKLHTECISGNPETLSPAQLHAKAWPIVESYFTSSLYTSREKFEMLNGQKSPLASTKLEDIFFAAQGRRVESLMISKAASQWGSFDLEKNNLVTSDTPQENDRDLINALVTPAILSGAEVYFLNLEEMPDEEPLAAVFRY